jgi:hypothetical protein
MRRWQPFFWLSLVKYPRLLIEIPARCRITGRDGGQSDAIALLSGGGESKRTITLVDFG